MKVKRTSETGGTGAEQPLVVNNQADVSAAERPKIKDYVRSLLIWLVTGLLMAGYCFIAFFVWLRERKDPLHRNTDKLISRLGRDVFRANPGARLDLDIPPDFDTTRNYIVVCNHQSMVDIPLLSHLPIKMKWVAMKAVFSWPFVGWLMRMSGGIPVDFSSENRRNEILQQANEYLQRRYSVIFFPEGRRTLDGTMYRFSRGAFDLAMDTHMPILPVVIDGLWDFLPRKSWVFRKPRRIRLKVLSPVETKGLTHQHSGYIRERIRFQMIEQLADWRKVPPDEIDSIILEAERHKDDEITSCPLYH